MTTTSSRPLSDKQERYIHEYCIDHNARQAALRAGYAASSCGSQAAALMRDPRVRMRIRANLRDLFTRLNLSAERLLKERAAVAFFDPATLIDKEGKAVPLHEIDPELRAALSITYQQKGDVLVLRVRQLNRHPALVFLEKRVAELEVLEREEEQEIVRAEYAAAFSAKLATKRLTPGREKAGAVREQTVSDAPAEPGVRQGPAGTPPHSDARRRVEAAPEMPRPGWREAAARPPAEAGRRTAASAEARSPHPARRAKPREKAVIC